MRDELTVTNIKVSFKIDCIINFEKIPTDQCLISDYKNIKIVIFDEYTISVMGKKLQCINVTGLKHFSDIIRVKILICSFFSIRQENILNFKIDSVCGVFKIPNFSLEIILLKLANHDYIIKKFPHFCGVKVSRGRNPIFMLFNSGKATSIGGKSEINFRLSHKNLMRVIYCQCNLCMKYTY